MRILRKIKARLKAFVLAFRRKSVEKLISSNEFEQYREYVRGQIKQRRIDMGLPPSIFVEGGNVIRLKTEMEERIDSLSQSEKDKIFAASQFLELFPVGSEPGNRKTRIRKIK